MNELKKRKKAFVDFYERYVDKIFRFVYFKVNSEEEAKDLTSEVFLKSWRYLKRNPGQEINNVQAFLFKTANNLVTDFYRKKPHLPVFLEDNPREIIDEKDDFLRKIIADSEMIQIYQALARVKKEYREVIDLYFLEELSIKEIAQIFSKSEGAIRVLVHRALKALRREVGKEEDSKKPKTV